MFSPGQQIGPYVLVERLGHGRFGVVWLADHPTSIVTTQVAIKLPLRDSVDVAVFRKEAQVWVHASGLPNILPMYTADVFDGQVLIASQYIPGGETLQTWLSRRREPPSLDAILQIAKGLLNGLSHLHAKSIIHRDLKPANILMHLDEPLIADFGMSRIFREDAAASSWGGSPRYMAPELWQYNYRSFQGDIWAVGVILFEMLSGYPPFDSNSEPALIRAILHDPPRPLPDSIPLNIRGIVETALRKNRNDRYKSAKLMLDAITDAEQACRDAAASRVAAIVIKRPHEENRRHRFLWWLTLGLFNDHWQYQKAFEIYLDSQLCGSLANGGQLYVETTPGTHILRAKAQCLIYIDCGEGSTEYTIYADSGDYKATVATGTNVLQFHYAEGHLPDNVDDEKAPVFFRAGE